MLIEANIIFDRRLRKGERRAIEASAIKIMGNDSLIYASLTRDSWRGYSYTLKVDRREE